MHVFKRFYLLGVLVASFCIPLITFTSYISVAPMGEFELPYLDSTDVLIQAGSHVLQPTASIDYLPIILWSIYGLRLFIFDLKFIYNRTENRVAKTAKY